MEIKLPNQLKIAGHTYKVIFPYQFRETKDLAGQAEYASLEIRIADHDGGGVPYKDSKVKEFFLHELMHCILHSYGDGEFNNERAVNCIANGLLQVLTDNQDILKTFITEEKCPT